MKEKKFGSVMGGQKTRISHLLLYLFSGYPYMECMAADEC